MRVLTGLCALVFGFATMAGFSAVEAQTFPAKPITILVGNPAGGPVDTVARMVADKLKESLGQPVIVENRVGGAGQLSWEALKRSAPDGYTLAMSTVGLTALKFLSKAYTLDPINDFTHISQLSAGPLLLLVNANEPYKNLNEFMAWIRANPGKLNFGSSGGANDLDIGLLQSMADIKITPVPYRGSAQLQPALISGEISAAFDAYIIAKPFIDEGKTRLIAVGSPTRFALWPDVPAITEAVPGYQATTNWFGMLGPPGMPADVTAKLSEHIRNAVTAPDIRKKLNEGGLDAVGSTPEQLRTQVADDLDRMGKAAKLIGLEPQ